MRGHQIAVWAGVYSFFAGMLAIGAINFFNPDDRVRFVGAFVISLITAGGVYAKQRLDDAKRGLIHGGIINITEIGDKKVFTLELDEDPVIFENKKEIIFRVNLDKVGDE